MKSFKFAIVMFLSTIGVGALLVIAFAIWTGSMDHVIQTITHQCYLEHDVLFKQNNAIIELLKNGKCL